MPSASLRFDAAIDLIAPDRPVAEARYVRFFPSYPFLEVASNTYH